MPPASEPKPSEKFRKAMKRILSVPKKELERRELADDTVQAEPTKRECEAITCPVCGEVAVQEKCKIICRSEKCRARVVMNCSEF